MNRSKFLTSFVPVFFFGAVALGAAGCGKSLPKLTDEQKAQLGDTMQASGRGASAARNIGSTPATTASVIQAFPNNWVTGLLGSSSPHSINRDETEISMEAKLKSAHDNKTCVIDANVPNGMSGSISLASNLNLSLKVSGNTCPLGMDFELSMQTSQSGAAGKVSCQYSVKDPEFAKLNDVNTLAFDGTFGAAGDRSSAKATLDLKGSLVSQKYGNVTFTASVSGTQSSDGSASGEFVTDFVFPTFEAKLSAKIDGKKVSYSINGEDVSEADFKAYFEKAGLPSLGANTGA